VSAPFAPVAVGSTPGRLRAGGASAELSGIVHGELARPAFVSTPTADGWETEMRDVGRLAFVAPAAAAAGGAVVQVDGCAGRLLEPGPSCRVRLSDADTVLLRALLELSVSWPA
jgi:hypothetical protein